jgi:uridine phosphorylase
MRVDPITIASGAVQMNGMISHGEIADTHAHPDAEVHRQLIDARKRRNFHVHTLKSVISVTFGR